MTEPNTKPEPERRELVCLGACLITGGKPGLRWAPVDDLDSPFAFPRKLKSGPMSNAEPGLVVSVPVDGDSIVFSQANYVRTMAADPRLLPWVLKHKAQIGQERTDAAFKSAKGKVLEDALKDMEAIRQAYKQTDHWGRLILEALLLQYLRNPS